MRITRNITGFYIKLHAQHGCLPECLATNTPILSSHNYLREMLVITKQNYYNSVCIYGNKLFILLINGSTPITSYYRAEMFACIVQVTYLTDERPIEITS